MYRTIDTKFWSDPKVRNLSVNDRYLFIYLITNNHTHLSGIYTLPIPLGVYESGLTDKAYQKGIDTLSEAYMIRFDRENDVVWVIKMFKYQPSGNKIKTMAEKQLKSLHNTPLINNFLDFYSDRGLGIDRVSIANQLPIIQEQEQEQEQEQGIEFGSPPKKRRKISQLIAYSEPFLRFWLLYPRKDDKKNAYEVWVAGELDSKIESVIEKVKTYAKAVKDSEQRWIKIPTTWLNAQDWDDIEPTAQLPQSRANMKLEFYVGDDGGNKSRWVPDV